MPRSKYYDHRNNQPIDLSRDGCDLVDWNRLYQESQFARHPSGFNIFLAPDKLLASDEYLESDPYTVEENINSEFHTHRFEVTLELVREAVSSIKGAPKILDLGCGQGHITEKIREAFSDGEVTGLDYSVSAIEYAHKHFPKNDFSVGDAYHCPYTDGYFDIVVCNNIWEHVPDPLYLLSRIKRSIKSGGYLIVSTPSRYRVINLVRILRGQKIVFMSQHHVTEYTVGQVKEQLAYGGFDVRRVASRSVSLLSKKGNFAKYIFTKLVKSLRSHHQLGPTVFYLAQERGASAK